IFDDANTFFGFIYTLGASAERNLPRVLTHPQTMNRLGKQNLIQLTNLSEMETEKFVQKLVNQFVDQGAMRGGTFQLLTARILVRPVPGFIDEKLRPGYDVLGNPDNIQGD
uniref:hypothetical protein n=1 Tax=Pontibacterium sp. TaxID=2036026 RepID=UPI003565A56A